MKRHDPSAPRREVPFTALSLAQLCAGGDTDCPVARRILMRPVVTIANDTYRYEIYPHPNAAVDCHVLLVDHGDRRYATVVMYGPLEDLERRARTALRRRPAANANAAARWLHQIARPVTDRLRPPYRITRRTGASST